jgi:DNA-directed RNA polymerase specialized sigma24 family protein
MHQTLTLASPGRGFWDSNHIAETIALAERQAGRCARQRQMGRADREDLRQAILLAMLERAHRFDPAIAPWAAFATRLARHAAADWLRAEQRRRAVTVPIEDLADALGAMDASATDGGTDVRTAIETFLRDVPRSARITLLLIAAAGGDVAAAQRASGLPPSSFYRALAALRFWLHAAGLRTASRWRGKNARVDR